jgi:stage IV sporulation protein FB
MVRSEKPLDNPINWSFRVGRLFDIDIRVHIAFVICAVIMIWMEMPRQGETSTRSVGTLLVDALGTYAMLFFIVLLHEFGHCFGARRVGGEADEILIWPLGGLAYANPPHNAQAHMVTTIAGPLVNVILCMICTVVLVAWTGSLGAVPWNPLHPTVPVSDAVWLTATTSQIWVMRFFGISYFILLINLLPIFPFDGGRIVQAWLWPRKGYVTSMEIATGTGMVGAILVGLLGLFTEQSWILLMIAVFGYMTCWQNRRMLKEQGDIAGGEFGYDFSKGYQTFDGAEEKEKKPGYFERRRIRQTALKAVADQKKREAHEKMVEAILRKISDSGMESLTPKERSILEEETARQRTTDKD